MNRMFKTYMLLALIAIVAVYIVVKIFNAALVLVLATIAVTLSYRILKWFLK